MTWQFLPAGSPQEPPVNFGGFQQNAIYLQFVESLDTLPNIVYQTILLDLAKWDAYWQQDRCNFVPVNLNDFPQDCCQTEQNPVQAPEQFLKNEIAMHQRKIQRWQNELQTGGHIPAVCFHDKLFDLSSGRQTLKTQILRIHQGRHRIAYLRQIGVPAFAAAIPEHLLPLIQQQDLHYDNR